MVLMDIHNPSFSMILSFIVFVFMVSRLLNRSKLSNSSPKLPPGPWKLPFIGNLHQFDSSLAHQSLRNLSRKYGPLMHLQLGEISTFVVSSPELAKEVMKTHDLIFASRPNVIATKILSYDCISIAFAPYGDYWRKIRKISTLELLSSRRVQSFRSIRQQEVSNLITSVASSSRKPFNFSKKVVSVSHGVTAKAAFGNKVQDQEEFISVIDAFVKTVSGFNAVDFFPSVKLLHLISGVEPKLQKLFKRSDAILEAIVNDHKSGKSTMKAAKVGDDEDLVDSLLKYQKKDAGSEFSLSNNNIKAVILDLISAGSETSSNIVNWAMAHMMKNPRVMERAQEEVRKLFRGKGKVDEENIQELKYLNLVIKETLRLHPPLALLLPRLCSERCEINGYEIPVGSQVIINGWAINRDPIYWNDAETFYPERFLDSATNYYGTNFEFIPFGAGRRMCPGISFGMANIELQLANLLFYFDWKLPNGMKPEDIDMSESFGGATVQKKEDLYLIPIPSEEFTIPT